MSSSLYGPSGARLKALGVLLESLLASLKGVSKSHRSKWVSELGKNRNCARATGRGGALV